MRNPSPVYPFATDPRPTSGHATYDALSYRMGVARAIANHATTRHCANPSPGSLRIAHAAGRAVTVAERRWVNHAFGTDGNYNDRPWLP